MDNKSTSESIKTPHKLINTPQIPQIPQKQIHKEMSDKQPKRIHIETIKVPEKDVPNLLPDPDNDKELEDNLSADMVYNAFIESGIGEDNPKTLREAKQSKEWSKWEKVIQIELDTLKQMGTWELMDAPTDRKPITSKWIFVKKYDKDGNLQKCKVHLVAQGFTQVPGMDYNEMFTPIVRLETIRAILALTVAQDWEIQQMDVKGAYLNSNLKEEIFMTQPEGFKDGITWLCHLLKTIYGLKQSDCEWNHKLNKNLLDTGFQCLQSDPYIYI